MSSGSVISISTKFDVLDATFHHRQRLGPTFLFDPTDARTPPPPGVERVGWSPLLESMSWERAVLSAESMVGASVGARARDGSHWLERASALLATLFHAAAIDDRPMEHVVACVNRHEADEFIAVLARRDANLALDLLMGIKETDAREQSSIWSTASGILAAYRTQGALSSTKLSPLDWAQFVNRPSTLYVASPADQQQHIAPLIAGLLRDLRSYCYSRTNQAGAQASNVLLILDELANIAPLHDLPALIAEGASQGIVTLASLQDLSQARARWGVAGDGFLSLFGAKIILGGIGDRATLSDLSILAGDHYVTSRSSGRHRRLTRWVSSNTHAGPVREPRLSPSQIANPGPWRATAVIGASPYHCSLTPYHLA